MEAWAGQVVNGFAFGMLLFLVASGLSLIYGVMRVVNMAHGACYMVGGFVGWSVMHATGNFGAALIGGAAVGGALGWVVERLTSLFRGQELVQALVTFGLGLGLSDLSLVIWGGRPLLLEAPQVLSGSAELLGLRMARYRLFLSGAGVILGASLWWLLERSRLGAQIRAVVDNAEVAWALGLDAPGLYRRAAVVGGALAGLAGVLGGPFLGVYRGLDMDMLLLSFAVVIVGGLGSFGGTWLGSLLVGLTHSVGGYVWPEGSYVILFGIMALVVVLKPTGLLRRM
jgi:branched-chain amino acid transport system permease protein